MSPSTHRRPDVVVVVDDAGWESARTIERRGAEAWPSPRAVVVVAVDGTSSEPRHRRPGSSPTPASPPDFPPRNSDASAPVRAATACIVAGIVLEVPAADLEFLTGASATTAHLAPAARRPQHPPRRDSLSRPPLSGFVAAAAADARQWIVRFDRTGRRR